MNNDLMKTKYEMVVAEIERIDEGLVWKPDRFGEFRRAFSAEEVIEKYRELHDTIDFMPELSDDEKTKLRELLDGKIKEVPEKEKQEIQEYENRKKEKEQDCEAKKVNLEYAWEDAKERYSEQSIFKKAIHTIRRTRPKDYERSYDYPYLPDSDLDDLYKMRVEDINKLYGGEHDR